MEMCRNDTTILQFHTSKSAEYNVELIFKEIHATT